jgi:hypothetical protein
MNDEEDGASRAATGTARAADVPLDDTLLRSLMADGASAAAVLAQKPIYLGAMSLALRMLPDVKSTHGLSLVVKMRGAAANGRRPITWGEAHDFLVHMRGLSPAGSKKTIRRLVQLKLVIPAPSPCIDKAKDLLATRRLAEAMPVLAQPYTVYRRSGEGDLERKKFDTAWLNIEHLHAEDTRLAEWLDLWRSQKPSHDGIPTSLTPFFASPLAKRPSPTITAVVSVAAKSPGDFEMLLCDGPALQDPPFAISARAILLRKCRLPSLARALKADFEQSKLLEEPLFHHLKGVLKGHRHDYFRLVLPLATQGRGVDCLLIVAELAKDRIPSSGPAKNVTKT